MEERSLKKPQGRLSVLFSRRRRRKAFRNEAPLVTSVEVDVSGSARNFRKSRSKP